MTPPLFPDECIIEDEFGNRVRRIYRNDGITESVTYEHPDTKYLDASGNELTGLLKREMAASVIYGHSYSPTGTSRGFRERITW